MISREEKDRVLHSDSLGNLESLFLEEDLFADESAADWEMHLSALDAETPFGRTFDPGRTNLIELEELEEEFVEEEESAWEQDECPDDEEESYEEAALSDLEGSLNEVYDDESESPNVEEEAKAKKALPRMKFEFQTRNRIWRNDANSPPRLLERKYGPNDFLVDQKGLKLESETNGVLEFETEWFRQWPAVKKAIEKAVKMTEDMNGAAPSKFEKKRKAFPFNIDHLRKGTRQEMKQGYWNPANYPRYENRHWNKDKNRFEFERILGAEEELEVEIINDTWPSGIQSSECFLLGQYESYLKDHEWPHFRDGAIDRANTILDAANTKGIPATELVNLRNFLQIIVNYIMRGQGGKVSEDAGAFRNVKSTAAKQAFTLMSRTSFSSMYRQLLTSEESALFRKIVKNDLILKVIGLNRESPFFIEGYGTNVHHAGPTAYLWLVGITRGKDLLSGRIGKGLSAAMGRYDVEIGKNKKDRWLVKFETRNTIIGATGIIAKDWVSYASQLYVLASERRRRPVASILLPLGSKAGRFLDLIAAGDVAQAISLAYKQGIADESKLANLVFHSLNLELGGRRIRKEERTLAQKWLQIRNDLVRPFLQSGGSHEIIPFLGEDLQEETELAGPFVDDSEGEAYDNFLPKTLAEYTGEVLRDKALREDLPEALDEVENDFGEFEEEDEGFLNLETGPELEQGRVESVPGADVADELEDYGDLEARDLEEAHEETVDQLAGQIESLDEIEHERSGPEEAEGFEDVAADDLLDEELETEESETWWEFEGSPTQGAVTVAELTSSLTNLVFWERNPSFKGKRLGKENKKQATEWTDILKNEIRPALHHSSTKFKVAQLIFFARHPEIKGRFRELSPDEQRKFKKEFIDIREQEVWPWLKARIARGKPNSRTIFIVNAGAFEKMPVRVQNRAGAEVAAQFAFVGQKESKAPITVMFLEPDRFPESYNFSDAVVSLIDGLTAVHVSLAIRQQEENAENALQRLGIKKLFVKSRKKANPERVGLAVVRKEVEVVGGNNLASPVMAAAVDRRAVISEVENETGKKLPKQMTKLSEKQQSLLGTALGRAIAHEARHLLYYPLQAGQDNHANAGLGSTSVDYTGTTSRATFSAPDQTHILQFIKYLETKQGSSTVVDTFAETDRQGDFPF